MKAVDKYVVYDDVNYIKGGWANRNHILINGEKEMFTVTLQKASQNKLFNEIVIGDDFKKLMKTLHCAQARFDRLVIVGGETSQTIFRELGVEHLSLGCALEPGVAQGRILDGVLAGKEFALKGGSMGTVSVLEKMMGCKEADY